jgi:hypothetical protein
MKLFFYRNKTFIIITVVLFCITLSEIAIDMVWGDGDGMLTNHSIHKYIFTVQLVFVYFLFFKLINKIYLLFFQDKISAQGIFQKTGQIFFMLVIIFSCFIVLEITSRYFLPSEGAFDRLYPVENARKPFPYVMFKGSANTPTGFANEQYNEHGYRGVYPKIPKESNEFRIILLGGSAVWEGDPSIPKLLEEEFVVNDFPNVHVYNFGIVSSVSSMELSVIIQEAIHLSPDLVIMYDGANEITSPLNYDPRPGYPFNFLVYENNPFFMKNYPALSLFLYKSNLIRLLGRKYFTEKFSRISELKRKVGYDSASWRNEIANIYVENLKEASTICNAYNSRLYAFLQPMVYFKKHPSEEEKKFLSNHNKDLVHSLLLKNLILQKINSIENDSSGFYFENLSTTYDSDSVQIFRDDVHTLQEAKISVAKEIFNSLKAKINFKK